MDRKEQAVFAARLGRRLRAVRRQRGWSLHDVEVVTSGEFKASALGTYERGDRRISLERLQRLARFYRVPVDRLLPDDGEAGERLGARRERTDDDVNVVIDLVALEGARNPEAEDLRRYVEMIRAERQDWNGRMMSIRRGDVRLLARLAGHDPSAGWEHLDSLGVVRHMDASALSPG